MERLEALRKAEEQKRKEEEVRISTTEYMLCSQIEFLMFTSQIFTSQIYKVIFTKLFCKYDC